MKLTVERSKREVKSVLFWREVMAEGLATLFLIFFIILVVISNNEDHYKFNTTHVGIMAGFLVAMLVEGFGHISGAHMNPAVSLGLFVVGHISAARVVAYIVIQFAGAMAGAGLGYLATPFDKRDSFTPFNPAPSMTLGQSIFLEATLTFNLVFIAMSCTDSKSRTVTLPGLPIGFAIGLGILAAGTHTGGVQNPAAAFSLAMLSGNFHLYWIYVVGPCIGGPVGAAAYTLQLWIKNRKSGGTAAVHQSGTEKDRELREVVPNEKKEVMASLCNDKA